MIKNRTVQLIYQTVYCTLGLVGCVACLGIFDDYKLFRWDFYVYFTNLSNFLCLGVMVVALIQTIKRKEDGFVTALPLLKFIGMLGILLTFLVFKGLSVAGIFTSATVTTVMLIASATPSATATSMFAEMFSGDTELSGVAVPISTVLSLATMPLVAMVLNLY
jgi:predicted permease